MAKEGSMTNEIIRNAIVVVIAIDCVNRVLEKEGKQLLRNNHLERDELGQFCVIDSYHRIVSSGTNCEKLVYWGCAV